LIAISLTQNGIEYKDVYAFSQPYHLNPYSPEVTFPYQMLNQILAKQGEKKRFIAFTSSGIDGVFLLNEKQFDYIIGDKVAYSNPLWKYFMLTGLSYPFYFENEINPYQTDTLTTNILQKWVDAGLVSVHYISWMQHKLQRYDSPKFTLNKFCYAYPSDFFRRETAQIKLSKKARTAQINAMQSYIQRLKNAGLLAPSKQDDKWVKSFQPKRTITFLNKINGS
jgi:hypothetical protein